MNKWLSSQREPNERQEFMEFIVSSVNGKVMEHLKKKGNVGEQVYLHFSLVKL